MSFEHAEQLGFDAAWDGKEHPDDLAGWLAHPELLAAWYRGRQQYLDWK